MRLTSTHALVLTAALSLQAGTLALAQRGPGEVTRARRIAPPATVPDRVASPRPSSTTAGPRPAIMLTGYWPPSNEALRRFSTDPVQNPGGWIGADWEGRGYDVHAFFPEFVPPDCFSCGQGTGDLEVDYQDTSLDFFTIADALEPVAIITFSRGFIDMSWELEMNQFNRSLWFDDFTAPHQPTPSPPDASVAAGTLRPSGLPVQAIVDAVDAAGLGLTPLICFSEDGGGFLSEFAAYLGLWYQAQHADPQDPAFCAVAGHIHIGGEVDWPTAEAATQVTLRTLTGYLDSFADGGHLQRYCPALPNSTGVPGVMIVAGSLTVGDDNLALIAYDLPTTSNVGYFIMGTGMNTFIPIGSLGPICVAPGLKRLLPPVSNTGEFPGGFSRSVGTSGQQTGLITPGSTWNFQAWHRDSMAFSSNLTDAVSVTFAQ